LIVVDVWIICIDDVKGTCSPITDTMCVK
jgi:hypothetical protein